MQLNKFKWNLVSKFLSPHQIKIWLKDPVNIISFEKSKKLILTIIFKQLIIFGKSQTNIYNFFSRYLPINGFLPIITNACSISNSKYEFLNDNGKLHIWKTVVNSAIMRKYWDQTGLSKCKEFSDSCKDIIKLLPGEKVNCDCCKWDVPQLEMSTDTLCLYCESIENKHKLVKDRNGNLLLGSINKSKIKINFFDL
jgi:hypothetical protein